MMNKRALLVALLVAPLALLPGASKADYVQPGERGIRGPLSIWTKFIKPKADLLYQPLATALTNFVTLVGTVVSGDIIYGSGAGTLARLAKGSDTQVLTLASGLPSWAAAGSGQPIPSSNTFAVGTLAFLWNVSAGSTGNGSTFAGSALQQPSNNTSTNLFLPNGSAMTGTWKNVSGATMINNASGYCVRTV